MPARFWVITNIFRKYDILFEPLWVGTATLNVCNSHAHLLSLWFLARREAKWWLERRCPGFLDVYHGKSYFVYLLGNKVERNKHKWNIQHVVLSITTPLTIGFWLFWVLFEPSLINVSFHNVNTDRENNKQSYYKASVEILRHPFKKYFNEQIIFFRVVSSAFISDIFIQNKIISVCKYYRY